MERLELSTYQKGIYDNLQLSPNITCFNHMLHHFHAQASHRSFLKTVKRKKEKEQWTFNNKIINNYGVWAIFFRLLLAITIATHTQSIYRILSLYHAKKEIDHSILRYQRIHLVYGMNIPQNFPRKLPPFRLPFVFFLDAEAVKRPSLKRPLGKRPPVRPAWETFTASPSASLRLIILHTSTTTNGRRRPSDLTLQKSPLGTHTPKIKLN